MHGLRLRTDPKEGVLERRLGYAFDLVFEFLFG